MFFNSITFFVFLAITFGVYWKTAQKSTKAGNTVLLIGSYIFYAWWDWRFLALILLSSVCDFFIGQAIYKTQISKKRAIYLIVSIMVNIGILFFFKYFNFFIDSFQKLTGMVSEGKTWNSLNIILPVGISFYTFQTLSYTIDIYKRKIEPTKSILVFFTFVAFFPQLVAGPIERAKHLIPQFERKAVFNYQQAKAGLKLILWGLFKKMVIADQFARLVDAVYGSPANFSGLSAIGATFLFGFQIYCDFSGYSDIAIGTARLFDKDLMINFRTPYFSSSFREFWHRWHISLSTWFRDYLYIPMGGNRRGTMRWVRNILVTFTVSGLWHGASVTFVIWGFIHGVFLLAERFFTQAELIPSKLKKALGFVVTFLLVNLSWVFFRTESFEQLKIIAHQILIGPDKSINSFTGLLYTSSGFTEPGGVLLFVFPLFILIEFMTGRQKAVSIFSQFPKIVRWGFYYSIVLAILFFGVLNSAPQFIYFQF